MVKVPAARFEPDKSRYDMAASSNIMNALPVADGWAPMPAPADQNPLIRVLVDENGVALTDELGNVLIELITGTLGATDELFLPSASLGGVFVRLLDGTTRIFVGTRTKLYQFDFTSQIWKDVSGSSAPYTCEVRWYFAPYGNTLYCGNGIDPEQMFEIGVDTVFSDNASAPVATDAAVVADFMMRALPDDSVQWSSLDDPTSNDVGIRFSDVQPFGDGNGVQRILPISSGALIIQRDKFEIMNFPDSEYVFRRTQLNGYRGSTSKWATVLIGQDDFVTYCPDGFFRGLNMQPIGAERVDRYILEVCDEDARQAMVGAADFGRKIVVFRVQKTDGTYLLLIYHWQLDQWTQSDADLADPFKLETVGLTIGQLDTVFPTIADLANVTWGSAIFDGGALAFGGVTSEGYLAMLTGPAMEATIETNEASLNGTDRAFVNGGRLDGDAANYTATLATADYKGQAFRARNGVSPSARTRFLALRGDGRVHKATVTIPSGESWTIYQGVDLDVVGSGKS
jgi:hypothetical protein